MSRSRVHTMTDKTNKIIIYSLVVGMFLCFGLIAHQFTKLELLQQRLDGQAETIERAKVAQMRTLTTGIYRLETLTDQYGEGETLYTIYNFVIDIKVGPVKQKLQFGYGNGDDAPFIMYLDNDSDGSIDTKTLTKYARTIPGAGFVSLFLFDPEYSQMTYDTFRANVDQVEQLSLDGLSQYFDDKILIIWTWLNEASDDIADWLEDSLEFE